MSIAVLLLRGMFYAMAFFIGNSSVFITTYCQNGERSMDYYCQETRFYERVRKIHLRKSGQNLLFRIKEGGIIYGRTIIHPIERAG